MKRERDGLVLIDKPVGMTSFDVIRVLRTKLGVKKIGHAGTLDPLASGLLVVALGAGTKELKDIIGLPKTYTALVRFGIRTETDDLEGGVVEERHVPPLSHEKVEKALASMLGRVVLRVPVYAATKQGGEALYKKVRRGEGVVTPKREMEIISAELLDLSFETARVEWRVGSGTYIRSLARELGERLGTVATLAGLRRTRVGDFSVEDAETIEF